MGGALYFALPLPLPAFGAALPAPGFAALPEPAPLPAFGFAALPEPAPLPVFGFALPDPAPGFAALPLPAPLPALPAPLPLPAFALPLPALPASALPEPLPEPVASGFGAALPLPLPLPTTTGASVGGSLFSCFFLLLQAEAARASTKTTSMRRVIRASFSHSRRRVTRDAREASRYFFLQAVCVPALHAFA